jgi:hypothetical protein
VKQKKIIINVLILIITATSNLQAQQNTMSSGDHAAGSNGSTDYSVGQVVYTTNTGANGSVAQGVQQAYEISAVTSISDYQEKNLNLSVYPNPTAGLLQLTIENYNKEDFSYQLIDMEGKTIQSLSITNSKTIITVNELATAIYFLKITHNNKVLKTFKIIKN